jgi:hypothetical protein
MKASRSRGAFLFGVPVRAHLYRGELLAEEQLRTREVAGGGSQRQGNSAEVIIVHYATLNEGPSRMSRKESFGVRTERKAEDQRWKKSCTGILFHVRVSAQDGGGTIELRRTV